MFGIAAPAPICADPAVPGGDQADCQVVFAPPGSGERLVADASVSGAEAFAARALGTPRPPVAADEEIRLTYGELTALIEDAVKQLR
jgi:hypothetical protein